MPDVHGTGHDANLTGMSIQRDMSVYNYFLWIFSNSVQKIGQSNVTRRKTHFVLLKEIS